MLAELFKALSDRAEANRSVAIHEVPGIPGEVLIRQADKYEWRTKERPRLAHELKSFDDLVTFVNGKHVAAPHVFHSREGITVFNSETRRESCGLPYVFTDRMATLLELGKHDSMGSFKTFDQRALVTFLRTKLSGLGLENLLTAVRKIDFTRNSSGSSSVEHGKESLGKKVEAVVQQREEIPEQVKIRVPVYANEGLADVKVDVYLAIVINVEEAEFSLQPLADTLQDALKDAAGQVALKLKTKLTGVPVFMGKAIVAEPTK